MPSHVYHPGDPCWVSLIVANSRDEAEDVALFVILDVYGSLFFWPEWNEFGYSEMTLQPLAEETITVIPEFSWPVSTGSASGIIFYSGMTDPEMIHINGVVTSWEFEWRD